MEEKKEKEYSISNAVINLIRKYTDNFIQALFSVGVAAGLISATIFSVTSAVSIAIISSAAASYFASAISRKSDDK